MCAFRVGLNYVRTMRGTCVEISTREIRTRVQEMYLLVRGFLYFMNTLLHCTLPAPFLPRRSYPRPSDRRFGEPPLGACRFRMGGGSLVLLF